ncbi:hypothetical protein LX36DRAFT_441605 [Colletotrichum falcatum]|nr:hypothetical protein LX36DRAFT_441605 [Colletotrichum falcatum]
MGEKSLQVPASNRLSSVKLAAHGLSSRADGLPPIVSCSTPPANSPSPVPVQLSRGAECQPLHPSSSSSSSLRGSSALGGLGSPTPFLLHHLTSDHKNDSQSCLGVQRLCVACASVALRLR